MPVSFNPSCLEVHFRYTSLGERCENVIWLQTIAAAPVSQGDLAPLANTLLLWWETNMKPLQHGQVQLREIYLRQALANGALEYTQSGDATTVGSRLGDPIPNNVTIACSFRTGLSGRSYRGRAYHIGITDPDAVGNVLNAVYVAQIAAAWAALASDLDDDGLFKHVIYSQYSNGSVRLIPEVTAVTTYTMVDGNIDSQRRRLAGRGQ